MLLLHQTGSVKIGEVVRYTVTYTPSQDRILPSPEALYLRIKNSSAIALRAAFVHGPYNLSVAAWPSKFNPNEKFVDEARVYGVPEFEPMLKAGGSWTCHLIVPEHIRQSAGTGRSGQHFGNGEEHDDESVTWVIEVASQVIFSTSAAVHYDIMLARDQKALNLPSMMPGMGSQSPAPEPGRVSDYQQSKGAKEGKHAAQSKGVFSRAIYVKVEDTASMWNTPQLPGMEQSEGNSDATESAGAEAVQTTDEPKSTKPKVPEAKRRKKTKVHLVILTHGLHSNLGSDLLYMKESIDAAAKQARIDAKIRREKERDARKARSTENQSAAETATEHGEARSSDESDAEEEEEEEEDPQVVVRGFSGNATRTERGIKYLGKRLARYVLCVTYPDQPFLPAGKAAQDVLSHVLKGEVPVDKAVAGSPSHKHSTIKKPAASPERSYQITNISFIAHSLGGLVQTYAVAYIQKHSPQFFDLIKPINFIALASPFLGLNHENPMYVKFALDFGLVGRTGQDLGLTWRAPTIARNGWGAIVGNLGESAHKKVLGEPQPESKPLLRILPTGPAHVALKKFRNRTVYSNVVNDGIVPLRTSCLLFLDWQGLGRVDKARREAGLVETVVGFGWAELTGANMTSPRNGPWTPQTGSEAEMPLGTTTTPPPMDEAYAHDVPQPPTDAVMEDDRTSLRPATSHEVSDDQEYPQSTSNTNNNNPFAGLFSFFKPNVDTPKPQPPPSAKQSKIYQRSQTLPVGSEAESSEQPQGSRVTSGHELDDDAQSGISAPPKTSFFESELDFLNPKLPSVEYLIDPEQRPRTIFHDRVYHPQDIPAPPLKKRPTGPLATRRATIKRTFSGSGSSNDAGTGASSPFVPHVDSTLSSKDYDDTAHTNPHKEPEEVIDGSNMKVEEKIARAYHRNLSWRKVLVKLEPDAHNNLICRRMFANAFGWPVVKHLVDAHFSDAAVARMRDEDLQNTERAKTTGEAPDKHGNETQNNEESTTLANGEQVESQAAGSKDGEARDTVPELLSSADANGGKAAFSSSFPGLTSERADHTHWSDREWADSGDDSDSDIVPAGGNGNGNGNGNGSGSGELCAKGQAQAVDEGTNKGQPERSTSPLSSAYWTEKIVGRGATHRQSRLASSKQGDGVDEGETEGALGSPTALRPAPLLSPGSAAGHVGLTEYPT